MNQRQYFEIEVEMETNAWRVDDPWMRDAPPPEGDGVSNIGQPVRCRTPLREGRTWGTAAASWTVIWPDGNNEPKSPAVLHSLSFSPLGYVSQEDIDADREGRPAGCRAANARRLTSWWERLSLTRAASAKRTTAKSDSLRGWWQTYCKSAEGGRIWRTRTDSVPDRTLSGSGTICTGSRTVRPKN